MPTLSSAAHRYAPLRSSEPEDPADVQWQEYKRQQETPTRSAKVLAVFLLFMGISFLSASCLHFAGHIHTKTGAPAELVYSAGFYAVVVLRGSGACGGPPGPGSGSAPACLQQLAPPAGGPGCSGSAACEAAVLQALPAGVFADPYELAGLEELGAC
ncbi:hypothetical protein WJX81_002637 [Elliptochloris bilobata]|uniref:Uncharacterized protein n=1 Tax=Elliptochloris bilobata TaxID=381761 RepID=A0AAW1QVZ9_9CHLO